MSKSDKPKLTSVFLNGIITENPTFRLVLGTCPTIATTTSVINAVGMGAAASFVLIGSNFVISLLRNFIPDKVRIPCFIVVICTFVTIVQLLRQAFVQSLYASLGMFIPLICGKLHNTCPRGSLRQQNGLWPLRWTALAWASASPWLSPSSPASSELLGTGCIAGLNSSARDMSLCSYPPWLPGGFMIFGLTLGVANIIMKSIEKKKKAKEAA